MDEPQSHRILRSTRAPVRTAAAPSLPSINLRRRRAFCAASFKIGGGIPPFGIARVFFSHNQRSTRDFSYRGCVYVVGLLPSNDSIRDQPNQWHRLYMCRNMLTGGNPFYFWPQIAEISKGGHHATHDEAPKRNPITTLAMLP